MSGKRITLKNARPNPLFEEWLKELYEEAKKKNSKLQTMLGVALNSITKYPVPIQCGADCAILKGFGKELCSFLDKRLEVYEWNRRIADDQSVKQSQCSKGLPESSNDNTHKTAEHYSDVLPSVSNGSLPTQPSCSSTSTVVSNYQLENNNDHKTVDKPKSSYNSVLNITNKSVKLGDYMPQYKSEEYAIITALMDKEEPLTKNILLKKAQIHCKEILSSAKFYLDYTKWTCLVRLINEGYIDMDYNEEVEFLLSDKGENLATKMEEKYKHLGENNVTKDNIPCNYLELSQIENNNSDDDSVLTLFPFSYNVIMLIDKKETPGSAKERDNIAKMFTQHPLFKYEYRHLNLGDYMWIAQHKVHKDQELVLPFILERKRMDDLGASIKDGRYHEQKFRLKRCGIKNVLYLIECNGKNERLGLPMQTLLQAVANTRIQDGFKIQFTDSLTASIKFLINFTVKIGLTYEMKKLKGTNRKPVHEELMLFEYFNTTNAKTKSITVKESFIKMLLQIKGVSVDKALAITNVYQTPDSLITAYQNCSLSEKHMLLATLSYGSKKVGPRISKTISQLFGCLS